MKAKIYKPSKSTMQSGRAASGGNWVMEYEVATPRRIDPLMGWISADDTLNQVKLKFDSLEAAQAFAEQNNIEYTVEKEELRIVTPRSYLDNFKFRPADTEEE